MSNYSSMIAGAKQFIRLWKEYNALSNLGFPESLQPGLEYNKDFGWKIVFGNGCDTYYPSRIEQFIQIAKINKKTERPCADPGKHETIDFKLSEWYKPYEHIN